LGGEAERPIGAVHHVRPHVIQRVGEEWQRAHILDLGVSTTHKVGRANRTRCRGRRLRRDGVWLTRWARWQ